MAVFNVHEPLFVLGTTPAKESVTVTDPEIPTYVPVPLTNSASPDAEADTEQFAVFTVGFVKADRSARFNVVTSMRIVPFLRSRNLYEPLFEGLPVALALTAVP